MQQLDGPGYAEKAQSHHALSVEQLNAIDLLLTGATDQHVASVVGRHPVTVARWRLYHPHFRAELVRRRREAHAGAADAFRTIIPMALDTLRDQLRVGANRGRIALGLLHKAGLNGTPGEGVAEVTGEDGDQILGEILDAEVRRRRAAMVAEDAEDDFNVAPTAPITEEERQAALEHLISLASEPEPA